MKHVLTLIGKPLDDAMVDAARRLAGTDVAPDWLAPGEACDLMLPGAPAPDLEARLRAGLVEGAVDVAIQPITPEELEELELFTVSDEARAAAEKARKLVQLGSAEATGPA